MVYVLKSLMNLSLHDTGTEFCVHIFTAFGTCHNFPLGWMHSCFRKACKKKIICIRKSIALCLGGLFDQYHSFRVIISMVLMFAREEVSFLT